MRLFDLTGKVALVTGGNGGIGLGMAEGLASCGAQIVVFGQNPDKNAAAEAKLKTLDPTARAMQVDVGDEAALCAAIAEVIATRGRLDFVAANAGVGGGGQAFTDVTTEAWRRITAINLDSVFWTFREACKHMIALVVTSSTSAIHGAPRNEAYASTKAAVQAMIRGIAVEHARYGIRANAILPGWIRSDMTKGLQAWDTFNEKAIGRVPMRRWGEPEDFAAIAAYFASDASRFHTGDSIVIDGGYTIF
jgi:NAD(P)-dependent dehydrogenase (short-subunit alcohol dehydrogenase family)